MITELKTLLVTCDDCGYSQQFVSPKVQYPPFWGTVIRSEYVDTRMENEKEALCPNCVDFVQHGGKYAKSTLKVVTK